jgi:hypothetical protein
LAGLAGFLASGFLAVDLQAMFFLLKESFRRLA